MQTVVRNTNVSINQISNVSGTISATLVEVLNSYEYHQYHIELH